MNSGGGTPSASNANSVTQYAQWFNELNKDQGRMLGGLTNQVPDINNSVMGGGYAPQGGVFNGGMTSQGAPVPRTPVANAYQGMPTAPNNSGVLTGGLNNLPTGGL